MKIVVLKGHSRESVGKKDAKALRRKDMAPCSLYGGKENINFAAALADFKQIVYTPEICFVEIEIEGKKYKSILQQVQFHPVTDKILHADFILLQEKSEIKMKVPVVLHGNSKGVMAGGKLILKSRQLVVKALPAHMPDTVQIDITNLEMSQSIKVGDVKLKNATILDAPSNVVVSVKLTRAAMAAEEASKTAAAGKKK